MPKHSRPHTNEPVATRCTWTGSGWRTQRGTRWLGLPRHPTTSLKVWALLLPISRQEELPACPDSLLHPTQTNWAGPSHPHRCGDIPLPRIHTWTACKPSATEETKVSHRRAVWTRAVEFLSGEQLSSPRWQKKNRWPRLLIECWARERLQNVAFSFPFPLFYHTCLWKQSLSYILPLPRAENQINQKTRPVSSSELQRVAKPHSGWRLNFTYHLQISHIFA